MEEEHDEHMTPPEIEYPDEVFDLAFHPGAPIVAAALISGDVHVHEYGVHGNAGRMELSHHKGACRSVSFSEDGQYLFTSSSDKSLAVIDMASGSILYQQKAAHKAAINALYVVPGENAIVTGDDNGVIKMWDLREQKCVVNLAAHEDFVSDIIAVPHKKLILSTGGDGTLSVINWRKGTRKASDQLEDELLSIAIMKGGRKVVCGTQDGNLAIYSWGKWGDFTDRMTGHPKSVDTLVKIDEDVLCTGSSDGLIRVVNIHPNKVTGVLGDHDGFPVERLHLSGDRAFLGSCSHDKTVKFWSLNAVQEIGSMAQAQEDEEGEGEEDEGEEEEEGDEGAEDDDMGGAAARPAPRSKGKMPAPAAARNDFFSDL